MTEREFGDEEINDLVLGLDDELRQVAVWAHLLKAKEAAGEIRFPITSLAELDPLFEAAERTTMSLGDDGSTMTLRRPDEKLVPPGVFPIGDLAEFVRAAYSVLVLIHVLRPAPRPRLK